MGVDVPISLDFCEANGVDLLQDRGQIALSLVAYGIELHTERKVIRRPCFWSEQRHCW